MKPNLAVLITGQYRMGQAIYSPLSSFSEFESTVFISTWSSIGSKLNGWVAPPQLRRVLGRAISLAQPTELIGDFSVIERFIPDFFSDFRYAISHQKIDANALGAITPHVDIETQSLFVDTLHSAYRKSSIRFIHYKLARALNMVLDFEKSSGKTFDFIVRMRPDILPLKKVNIPRHSGIFEVDWVGPVSTGGIVRCGDNFILGTRDVVFSLVEHLRETIYDRHLAEIHSALGEFAQRHSLEPHRIVAPIADDVWPRDKFIDALRRKAQADANDGVAAEFLSCTLVLLALEEGHLPQAEKALETIPENAWSKPPVLLARGAVLLARRQTDEADALLAMLDEQANDPATPHASFYRDGLRDERQSARLSPL